MTDKEKIKCKECGSKYVIKKGKNKAKFAVKQIYKCKDCGKKFSLDKLKNKTYSVRSSEFELNIDFDKIKVFRKENYACKLAKLALCITKNNTERHTAIEKFMLCNDTCTIAVEVPVYVYLDEIKQYGVLSLFRNSMDIILNEKRINETTIKNNTLTTENKNVITGYIDFVQLNYEFAPSDIILRFCDVPKYRVREFFVRNRERRYFTSEEFNEKLSIKINNED